MLNGMGTELIVPSLCSSVNILTTNHNNFCYWRNYDEKLTGYMKYLRHVAL